ncbi:MAG: hypothetical protein ABIM89_17750 [Mycobacteriales bacterium]
MTGFELEDPRHPVDRMLQLWKSPPGPDESAVPAFRDVYVDPYRVNGTSMPVLQIVQRARVLHAALDGLEHVVLDRVEVANRTVLLLRQEGIHVGPLPTPLGMLAPTGRRLHRRLVEFIEHDNHRLLQVTALGDDLERLMQAEAVCLIEPGSSSAASE